MVATPKPARKRNVTRKRPVDFATDRDGTRLFIRASSSGIPWLNVLIDGVSITLFGRETTPYIDVKMALAWHRQELADTGREPVPRMIEALTRVLQKFEAGQVVEV